MRTQNRATSEDATPGTRSVLAVRVPAVVASLLYDLAEHRNVIDKQTAAGELLSAALARLDTERLPGWYGDPGGSTSPIVTLPAGFLDVLAGPGFAEYGAAGHGAAGGVV